MTGAEAIRQASILVSVLLADGVITEKEAEILRQVLGPTNCEWNQDKDKIQAAIRHQGMTLIKTSNGYDLVSLGEIRAQALSLSDQQPAAWPHKWGCRANAFGKCDKGCTAPPKRELVGLTEEEIANIANACRWSKGWHSDFARAIEAALKKKNNE